MSIKGEYLIFLFAVFVLGGYMFRPDSTLANLLWAASGALFGVVTSRHGQTATGDVVERKVEFTPQGSEDR